MTIAQLIEGLQIIARYNREATVDVYSGRLMVGTFEPGDMSAEELDQLGALGFFESESTDGLPAWAVDP